jgi:NAD(P)-dependent dehydrogenase (short-subunit alcohol dehydrogenase family)
VDQGCAIRVEDRAIADLICLVVGDRESDAYSATKFAVIAFSEALEHALKGTGIVVSVVIPGAVSTDFSVNSGRSRGSIGGPNRYAETPPDIAAGLQPEEVVRRMHEEYGPASSSSRPTPRPVPPSRRDTPD